MLLVLIIVKAVDVFLTGSGAGQENECVLTELDKDGIPLEGAEQDCKDIEDEWEERRLFYANLWRWRLETMELKLILYFYIR